MNASPPKSTEDLLGDSWIELGNNSSGPRTPERVTPLPFQSGEEYLRLLREAQRESNQSSRVVSLASSRRNTPHDSPKSPPNSPNTELCNEDELKGVYINYWNKGNIEKPVRRNGVKTFSDSTPLPFQSGEEYLRLLREAQRESNQSSRVVSLASSRRNTPHDSPKSPPNSPNTELCNEDELKGVYINYWNKEGELVNPKETGDWIWEWSSRPDQLPPKGWNFEHPRRPIGYSMRLARVGKNSLFSREVLYSLLITNVLSLLLGAGFGLWLSKRNGVLLRLTLN